MSGKEMRLMKFYPHYERVDAQKQASALASAFRDLRSTENKPPAAEVVAHNDYRRERTQALTAPTLVNNTDSMLDKCSYITGAVDALPPSVALTSSYVRHNLSTTAAGSTVSMVQPWFVWSVSPLDVDIKQSHPLHSLQTRHLLLYSEPLNAGSSGVVYIGRMLLPEALNGPNAANVIMPHIRSTHAPEVARAALQSDYLRGKWVAVKVLYSEKELFVGQRLHNEVEHMKHATKMVTARASPTFATLIDYFRLSASTPQKVNVAEFDRFFVPPPPQANNVAWPAHPLLAFAKRENDGLNGGVIIMEYADIASSLKDIGSGGDTASLMARGVVSLTTAPNDDVAKAIQALPSASNVALWWAYSTARVRTLQGLVLTSDRAAAGRGVSFLNERTAPFATAAHRMLPMTVTADAFTTLCVVFQLMFGVGAMYHRHRTLHGDLRQSNIVVASVNNEMNDIGHAVFSVSDELTFAVPYHQPVTLAGQAREYSNVMHVALVPKIIDFSAGQPSVALQHLDGAGVPEFMNAGRHLYSSPTTVHTRCLWWSLMRCSTQSKTFYTHADDVYSCGVVALNTLLGAADDDPLQLRQQPTTTTPLSMTKEIAAVVEQVADVVVNWVQSTLVAAEERRAVGFIYTDLRSKFADMPPVEFRQWVTYNLAPLVVVQYALQGAAQMDKIRDVLKQHSCDWDAEGRVVGVLFDGFRKVLEPEQPMLQDALRERIVARLMAHDQWYVTTPNAANVAVYDFVAKISTPPQPLFNSWQQALVTKQGNVKQHAESYAARFLEMIAVMTRPHPGDRVGMRGVLNHFAPTVFHTLLINSKRFHALLPSISMETMHWSW